MATKGRMRQATTRANRRRRRTSRSVFAPVAAPVSVEQELPRGIKLKTVSRLTLLFAVICLGAFLAGRPPVAADGHAEAIVSHVTRIRAGRRALRNDDARRVLFSLSR